MEPVKRLIKIMVSHKGTLAIDPYKKQQGWFAWNISFEPEKSVHNVAVYLWKAAFQTEATSVTGRNAI